MPDDWMSGVCSVEAVAAPDPAPGIARLDALFATVEGAEANESAIGAVAALLQDDAAMAEVLDAYRVRPDAVSGSLMRIGARRGLKAHVERLGAGLRAKVKELEVHERRTRLRVARPDEQQPSLSEILPNWSGLPVGLYTPPGWSITPDAIYKVVPDGETGADRQYLVFPRPMLLSGRLRDVEDDTTWVRIDWSAEGHNGHRVVPRGQIADSRLLPALANFDAPLHSGNARDAVTFLATFEEHNRAALPEARVSSRMGWQGKDGALGFLWGRTLLNAGSPLLSMTAVEDIPPLLWTKDQVHLLAEAGAGEMADGFRSSGSWEGWLQVVSHALPHPSVLIAVYASLVPPLMPLIPGLSNFIVDWSGITSSGKTTALRLGASVWGSPDERGGGLVRSWDATRVWIERTSGVLHCLPMFLDDTKRARRPGEVGQVLYDVANGVGRGRGSVGGTRTVATWRTVLLSTGETPATSFTQDGGTRARTLCLWGHPFGVADESTAGAVARINAGVLEHFGHAGPRMISWLVNDPEARAKVLQGYKAALAWWSERAGGNPVAGRAAQYMAALTVARSVVHEVLGVAQPGGDPLEVAWVAVCDASSQADRATEALRDVLSWATGQQGRFYGRIEGESGSDDDPPGGWLGAWPSNDSWLHLAVLPTELKLFLDRQGYDTEAMLRTWDERGWLSCDPGKHRSKKVTVGGRRERCVVLTRAACEIARGDSDAG